MAKVRLGDIAAVVTKGTTPTTIGFQFEDSGINFVKIESISEDGTFLKEKFSHISDKCNVQMRRSQLQENDILFSIAGAIGRSAIVTKEILPANTNQALAIIRVPKGKIDYNYLLYALSSSAINQQATQHQQGVAQLNISLKNVSDFLLPIYTEAMQKRIVHNLKKIDKLIFLRKQQLAKLDELVKVRFVEMFGEPVSNPMGWEKKKLQDVCYKLTDGTHFSPGSYDEGDYKYITAKNIKSDGFDFSNITYVPESVHRTIYERCNPELGDVLYIKDGATTGIAMVNSLEEEFSLLSSVALLKQNRKVIDGRFLCGVLNNAEMYKSIRSNMGGAAITRLTIAKLQKIMVIVPSLPLQKQFAAFVKRVDQQKQTVQQSLEKLELMKKALMQEYFG